jgi:hypothetical protein
MKPLSSFNAKIRMGFALKLYGERTFHDLELLRDLRNLPHSNLGRHTSWAAYGFAAEPVRVPGGRGAAMAAVDCMRDDYNRSYEPHPLGEYPHI